MPTVNVLIVDDEKALSTALQRLLAAEGIFAVLAFDGESGIRFCTSENFDVIVLDITMPGRDGVSVLRAIRAANVETPVMMLTGRMDVDEKVLAFSEGADDYLTKPFATKEFVARLKALARRKSPLPLKLIKFGDSYVDLVSKSLKCGENSIALTKSEFEMLCYFAENPGHVFSRQQITMAVWGIDCEKGYNACDVYVSLVRKKLAAVGSGTQIKTVRGFGYSLDG